MKYLILHFTPHTVETMITMLIKVLYINSLLLSTCLMSADQYLLAVLRSNLKTKVMVLLSLRTPVDTVDTFNNKLQTHLFRLASIQFDLFAANCLSKLFSAFVHVAAKVKVFLSENTTIFPCSTQLALITSLSLSEEITNHRVVHLVLKAMKRNNLVWYFGKKMQIIK